MVVLLFVTSYENGDPCRLNVCLFGWQTMIRVTSEVADRVLEAWGKYFYGAHKFTQQLRMGGGSTSNHLKIIDTKDLL